MTEEWRDVVGYAGRYQVSNLGRLKSLTRSVKRSDGRIYTLNGRILKPYEGNHAHVNLRADGKTVTRFVHELVATMFLPKPPYPCEVCHDDGDGLHNVVMNLRWGTRKENIEDRRRHGTLVCGTNVNSAKLNDEKVRDIKRRLASESVTDLAREFGVGTPAISNINTGKTWKHV